MSIPLTLRVEPGEERAEFIVDNTAQEVAVTTTGPGVNIFSQLLTGFERTFFNQGENFIIREYGIMCPHAFVLSEPIVFDLHAEALPSAVNFNLLSGLVIPTLNVPVPIDQHVSLAGIQLQGGVFERNTINAILERPGKISMLNVPGLINGATIPLYPWMIIEANFNLELTA